MQDKKHGSVRHWFWFQHIYQPVAVGTRFEPFMNRLTGVIRTDVGSIKTDILCQCACGKKKVKTLIGRWTLEQLQDLKAKV